MHRLALLSLTIVALVAARTDASTIEVYGGHSDSGLFPGAGLRDVSMTADLSATGGIAIMTFTNTSSGLETSAVFKEIVVDTHDADTGTAVLWNPVVLTNTKDVSYSVGPSNGLPGYGDVTRETVPLIEFQARSSPVKKGIGPGEMLRVQFDTSLGDGSDATDYLQAFSGGTDTAMHSIGFHAISSSIVYGQSLSGTVPEPGTVALLLGGSVLAWRRRR